MALSWMERLFNFFTKEVKENHQTVVEEKEKRTRLQAKEKTEFEKIIDQFNFLTDMIVISYEKAGKLSKGERDWLDSLGNKVYYFDNDVLINVAIVRS